MSKLDFIDAKLHFKGTLEQIFMALGENDSRKEDSHEIIELKTTSVRLPPTLLNALDKSLSFHKLTRQDSFAYMVHDFISHSIVSYSIGVTKVNQHNKLELQDFIDTYDSVIDQMSDDYEVRTYLREISEPKIKQFLKDFK